jgi:hypothetical protein
LESFLIIKKLKELIEASIDCDNLNDFKLLLDDFIKKYDDLYRLFKWREKIILKGDELKKYGDELKKIENKLISEGFYISDDKIDTEIRLLFNKIK